MTERVEIEELAPNGLAIYWQGHLPTHIRPINEYDSTVIAAIRQQQADIAELQAVANQLGAYKDEAEKWEQLFDEVEHELCDEVGRDVFNPVETIAECAKRILRERNEARAKITEIEAAPTVAIVARMYSYAPEHLHVVEDMAPGEKLPPIRTELIARPK